MRPIAKTISMPIGTIALTSVSTASVWSMWVWLNRIASTEISIIAARASLMVSLKFLITVVLVILLIITLINDVGISSVDSLLIA